MKKHVEYADFELQFIEIKDICQCKIGYKESFISQETDDNNVSREVKTTEECTRIKLFGDNDGLKKALTELSELVPARVTQYQIKRLDVVDYKDWFNKLKIKFSYRIQNANEITSSTKDINIQETFGDMFSNTVQEVNTALERLKMIAYVILYEKEPIPLVGYVSGSRQAGKSSSDY